MNKIHTKTIMIVDTCVANGALKWPAFILSMLLGLPELLGQAKIDGIENIALFT